MLRIRIVKNPAAGRRETRQRELFRVSGELGRMLPATNRGSCGGVLPR